MTSGHQDEFSSWQYFLDKQQPKQEIAITRKISHLAWRKLWYLDTPPFTFLEMLALLDT